MSKLGLSGSAVLGSAGGIKKIFGKRNLGTFVFEVVFLLFSAFVLALAFPGLASKDGLGFLAAVALIPLFAVIRSTKWKFVWLYGFLYGFVFYRIFNFWLSAFHPLANLLVQVIKGTEMIFLFLALKAAVTFFPKKATSILQALFWVCYAFLSQSWFAGYPYGTVAYAFFRYKVLIQIADFSGIWLLTFLIVLPQEILGNLLYSHLTGSGEKKLSGVCSRLKEELIAVAVFGVLFVFQLVYGVRALGFWSSAVPDSSFTVATVQHNADSWEGGYLTYRTNFNNLKRMSLEAAIQQPDMIIWSETAFVPSVLWYTEHPYEGDGRGSDFTYLRNVQTLVKDFVSFGKELGIPLLTGNSYSVLAEGETQPYTETGEWNNKIDYNAVILFDDGEIRQTYLKQHLVPFTEYFPYEKQLPALYKLLKSKDYHWWQKGTEPVVFSTSTGITFSTPICFEDVFGDVCAGFVKNGADLLVNMTNDSWSGSVAAERQHMAMAVLRSVENRRTMIRGTNSGITCLILPDGSIAGEMEPFRMAWQKWEVPVYEGKTFGKTVYTEVADRPIRILCVICIGILFAGCVAAAVKSIAGRRKKTKEGRTV